MSLTGCEKLSPNNAEDEFSYSCINCGALLREVGGSLSCPGCSAKFEVRKGIPILTAKERYWCNLRKEEMEELNNDAEAGYWKDALAKRVGGNVANHAGAESRIDFRFILPSLKEARVLDIGSMWGGVAVPLARYSREIYAVDTTYQTLRFLLIRAQQDGVDNLKFALASAHKLPFRDGYFDSVLFIGVLEWLGSNQDFVAKDHFGKARRERPEKTDPEANQMKALSEAHRVLKPGGRALIAIENRFFYKYFFGWQDAHTGVPFSAILPRPLANLYMRILKNQDYTEYTYSYDGYKRMLASAGFKKISFYATMPSYRELNVIVPLDNERHIGYYYKNYGLRGLTGIKRMVPEAVLGLKMMRYFVPSYLIVVEK